MTIMQKALSALAFASVITSIAPAHALSCIPRTVRDAYTEAAKSKDRYLAVYGALRFDEKLLPETDFNNQQMAPEHTMISARIRGHFLTAKGFVTPIDAPVNLDVQCFGPWCGGAKSGEMYLVFLKENDKSYDLSITPCIGNAFATPSEEALEEVLQCHDGGPCETWRPPE